MWVRPLLLCRSEREAFNIDNQHRFEDALAAVTPRRTAALERMHLQKFQDEGIRQYASAAQVKLVLCQLCVPIMLLHATVPSTYSSAHVGLLVAK